MPEEIVFSWTGSARAGAASTDPWSDKPAWARVAGFGCAALSSTSPPPQDRIGFCWRRRRLSGAPTRCGCGCRSGVHWVKPSGSCTHLRPRTRRWPSGATERQPCRRAGWPAAGCWRYSATTSRIPSMSRGRGCEIVIEEAIALPDLAARFAPDTAGERHCRRDSSLHPHSSWGCHWGDLHYLAASAEGDVHEWAVWQRHPGGASVILGGERVWDDDIIYAGHRPLSAAELREVEAWQVAAERGRAGMPPDPRGTGIAAVPTQPDEAAVDREPRRGWRGWERWRSRSRA